MKSTKRYVLDHALLPEGWAASVGLDVENGVIQAVERQADGTGRERISGIVLPGMPNLHSHAFQRGMAGLAEIRGPVGDTFWTWREVMYRFLRALTPEDVEAIAAFAYLEMIESGFTWVGEFHYLHHDPSGEPYADLAELAGRIAAAARQTGIGLTLLPCFYAYGGFGGADPVEGQRRFINDPDRFLRLYDKARQHMAGMERASSGIAPHSLRAVTPETLGEILAAAPSGPIHIHAAEQVREVRDCLAWSGKPPVEWLLDNIGLDSRWCLIHATHMTPAENKRLAQSGAVAGLCPITEASLGDGIFGAARYLRNGGRLGIGTDSNIEITPAGELRQLEYGQRLVRRERNVLAGEAGTSIGRRLFELATEGGAQALGRKLGWLSEGHVADFVVLDEAHPDLVGRTGDHWLDAWMFVAGSSAINSVYLGGEQVVANGRHRDRDVVLSRYRSAMLRLLAS